MAEQNGKTRIGMALGGGGAKGLAHVGILKVLGENGIVPEMVAGTSIGALIGALYCARGDIGEVERFVARFQGASLGTYLAPRLTTSGLISGKKVYDFLFHTFGTKKIEDLGRPFFCVAADLDSGEEIVFDRGPLVDALMASISIPLVFPPYCLGGRYLADGGLVNLVPVDVLHKKGATFAIGVNVLPARKKKAAPPQSKKKGGSLFIEAIDRLLSGRSQPDKPRKKPNMVEVMLAAFEIMQMHMTVAKLKEADPDVVIHVDTSEFKLYDFHTPLEIIRRGETTAWQLLGFVQHALKMCE